VGLIGCLANAAAVFVSLRSKRIPSTVFNALLVCLLATHTLYILDSLALVVYKACGSGFLMQWVFAKVLYPVKTILLYLSTYITVLMARERCRAVRYG